MMDISTLQITIGSLFYQYQDCTDVELTYLCREIATLKTRHPKHATFLEDGIIQNIAPHHRSFHQLFSWISCMKDESLLLDLMHII